MTRRVVVETQDNNPAVNMELFAMQDIDPESLRPELHYRFISTRPSRLARARAQGYRFVHETEVKRLSDRDFAVMEEGVSGDSRVPRAPASADGFIYDGDGVLMACPRQTYEEREAKQAKLKHARLGAPEGSVRKKARDYSASLSKPIKLTSD